MREMKGKFTTPSSDDREMQKLQYRFSLVKETT